MVSGQVVDTITNIKTVKLFAHAAFEDKVALRAMEVFREQSGIRRDLHLVPAVADDAGGGAAGAADRRDGVLWQQGAATAGAIAAAGAISMRIAQMSGWVSFTLMSIYTSVGEVEDGMRTLTVPHTLADAPDAAELPRVRGEVRFDHVSFAYGRRAAGWRGST
jgi:ATP-binding cassette, subfamily B, bacterial